MATVAYEDKRQRLMERMRSNHAGGVRLEKNTSNLFRDRKHAAASRLDVRDFDNVLAVNREQGWVEAEGMTPYAKLVSECLKHGVMPAVVPQLKSITLGGAVTGCGIESSSFRYGLVHETVESLEVLLGDGSVVAATPTNEYQDLFFAFPNSYGTLGYALKVVAKVVPVKKFVALTHIKHHDPDAYFADIQRHCDSAVDFVDGTIFGPNEMYITLGRFTDEAPYTSDYTYERIYYRSIRERTTDYLTIEDYLWRWDTDWFWCSKNVLAQNPLVRRIYGRERLNSITYTKIMRWNSRAKLTHYLHRMLGIHTESVIQDVEIPIAGCAEFFNFYFDTIKLTPVWVCPTRAYRKDVEYDLYRMEPNTLYLNFGFWDVIRGRAKVPAGFYNRKVEHKVAELRGMKSLYSDSYYSPAEFWRIYNKSAYDSLKRKYDPRGLLKDLYAKCVLRE